MFAEENFSFGRQQYCRNKPKNEEDNIVLIQETDSECDCYVVKPIWFAGIQIFYDQIKHCSPAKYIQGIWLIEHIQSE